MAPESDKSDRLFPPGDTLGDILFGDRVPLSESRSILALFHRSRSLNIYTRWGLTPDDADAYSVVKRLAKRDWSDDQRLLVLNAAEQIAYAERAKADWNPKNDPELVERYKRLANEAVTAAELALAISRRCQPSSWRDDKASQELITQLVDYLGCALQETATGDHYVATRVAVTMLHQLTAELKKRPSALIAALAWLASGKQTKKLRESAIRKYARATATTPAGQIWNKHGALVVQALRLVPPEPLRWAFTHTMRDSLRKPGSRSLGMDVLPDIAHLDVIRQSRSQ